MRQPRARPAESSSFVVLLAIAFVVGCASVRPIRPGELLRATEGLLVLQVRTGLALRSISISGSTLPLDVRPGTHLQLVAVSAGSYRWSGLGIAADVEDSREPGIKPGTVALSFADSPELRFRVEPGRINYPGMLEIEGGVWQVGMRSVDRTALVLDELRAKFPTSVAHYPIVYSGPARHVFLERYFAAESARKRADAPGSDAAR